MDSSYNKFARDLFAPVYQEFEDGNVLIFMNNNFEKRKSI